MPAQDDAFNCHGAMQAPPGGVKVRMYRVGLGDCFLLAFGTGDPAKPYYVLIDCGSIGKTEDGPSLEEVADDIKAATCGRIDLLVISHRHADHIAGFDRPAFKGPDGIKVQNLWLPFLEDLDVYANLWNRACKVNVAVQTAIAQIQDPAVVAQLKDVSAFVAGPAAAAADHASAATPAGVNAGSSAANAGSAPAEKKKDPCADPLADIKKFVAKPLYRKPSDSPLPLPDSAGTSTPAGVKLYVLGPPSPEQPWYLFQEKPSRPDETYFTGAGLTSDAAFLFGVLDKDVLSPDELVLQDLSFPFDKGLRIPWETAGQDEFFKQHYGVMGAKPGEVPAAHAGSRPTTSESNDPGGWRTIDDDWLGVAAAAAAQLDNLVNNTTLALAIELPKTGRVLMFVGDAQVGNWQSWHDLPWTTPDGKPLVPNLFKRTVLYKVGHHGSVNATAQCWADPKNPSSEEPWGLPLMTSPNLVALLPVDTHVASQKGVKPPGWVMPWTKMYTALRELTRGRIICVDKGFEVAPTGGDNDPWASLSADPVVSRLYDEVVILDS